MTEILKKMIENKNKSNKYSKNEKKNDYKKPIKTLMMIWDIFTIIKEAFVQDFSYTNSTTPPSFTLTTHKNLTKAHGKEFVLYLHVHILKLQTKDKLALSNSKQWQMILNTNYD